MKNKLLLVLIFFFFGFLILFISVLRASQIRFKVGESVEADPYSYRNIPYELAYPGKVVPGNPLWAVKVARDKVWLVLTTNKTKKAELLLLLADKRLSTAVVLLEKGDHETSLTSLVKSSLYLEQAFQQAELSKSLGYSTGEILRNIAYASMKHYDVMEAMKMSFPDDVRVVVVERQKMPKLIYERSRNSLIGLDLAYPENPFNW